MKLFWSQYISTIWGIFIDDPITIEKCEFQRILAECTAWHDPLSLVAEKSGVATIAPRFYDRVSILWIFHSIKKTAIFKQKYVTGWHKPGLTSYKLSRPNLR